MKAYFHLSCERRSERCILHPCDIVHLQTFCFSERRGESFCLPSRLLQTTQSLVISLDFVSLFEIDSSEPKSEKYTTSGKKMRGHLCSFCYTGRYE